MKLPEHLRGRKNHNLHVLRRFANGIRGLYGQPVYLCGSALLDGNRNPRDWDVRVTLTDEHFVRRYGNGSMKRGADGRLALVQQWEDEAVTGLWTAIRWRWSDDCVKRSLHGSRETGLNIDFQVYAESHVAMLYRKRPKLRIDTRPASLSRRTDA